MYESHFGLDRRPFLATPDPDCFVAGESAENALAGLRLCVEACKGFGILSAAAGTGKTLLCRKLIVDLRERYATVFLANSNFPTRRSLLQAILYELGHPYLRMAEQELRLELKSAATQVRPGRQAVLLVVDEAHLLSIQLLEELRTVSNVDVDGGPLIHVVLSGQLPLEEKLAGPELAALGQRIGCQVSLDTLSRRESAMYVAERLRWAGAEIDDVLLPDALDVICYAADGLPRCLNQLCDHSLLLAYVSDEHPVSASTVREALDDLKQLPLHWNEPRPASSPLEQLHEMAAANGTRRTVAVDIECDAAEFGANSSARRGERHSAGPSDVEQTTDGYEYAIDAGETSAVEVGAPVGSWRDEETADAEPAQAVLDLGAMAACDFESDDAEGVAMDEMLALGTSVRPARRLLRPDFPNDPVSVEEEIVVDRYAMLDAGLPIAGQSQQRRSVFQPSPPVEPTGRTAVSDAVCRELSDVTHDLSDLLCMTSSAATPDQLIDAIEPLIDEALNGGGTWDDEAVVSVSEIAIAPSMVGGDGVWTDVCGGVEAEEAGKTAADDADADEDEDIDEAVEYDVVQPEQPGVPATAYPSAGGSKQQRRYANLFSKLRRQQRSA